MELLIRFFFNSEDDPLFHDGYAFEQLIRYDLSGQLVSLFGELFQEIKLPIDKIYHFSIEALIFSTLFKHLKYL